MRPQQIRVDSCHSLCRIGLLPRLPWLLLVLWCVPVRTRLLSAANHFQQNAAKSVQAQAPAHAHLLTFPQGMCDCVADIICAYRDAVVLILILIRSLGCPCEMFC